MSERAAWLAFNAAGGWLGPRRLKGLLDAFGKPEAVLEATPARLAACGLGLGEAQARALLKRWRAFDARAELEAMQRSGTRALLWGEEGYPALLREVPQPPPLLYLRGRLPPAGAPALAVVGTRAPSEYGKRMARSIAAGLGRAGAWVVSGLARGIDAAAHAACLEAGSPTLAVLGTGLDRIYPAENRPLAGRILEGGGGLLSQFPLAEPGQPWHFPMRNAVLSGLCLACVVVEGRRRSGALITAREALEQGREVFAVPGPADAETSQAPLDLIRDGAGLARSAEEILEALGLRAAPGWRGRGAAAPAPRFRPGSPEQALWEALPAEREADLDGLAAASGLDAAALAAALTQLELLGLARRGAGTLVRRCA